MSSISSSPDIPDLPVPADVRPVDVPQVLAQIEERVQGGPWLPLPNERLGADVLCQAVEKGYGARSTVAIGQTLGLPPCPDNDWLLARAIKVEAAWGDVQPGRTPIDVQWQGITGFLFDVIRTGLRPISYLAVYETWERHRRGRSVETGQLQAFEQAVLAPWQDYIDLAVQRLDDVLTLADRLARVPGKPIDAIRSLTLVNQAFGFPHSGWSQEQRRVWESGFLLPGAPPEPDRDGNEAS